ncbi:hypothetical protein NLJ89_g10639 [Agrocybe chaxingu]|uniref:Uncharacterized protein n=1 Tax=Agrocybe chaxingu TaxID=84603 RepID=A0A9W8JRD0_9AGAR|nr:hypothetical protein NLJ89_g10639 [Agrocybe chaxingu]
MHFRGSSTVAEQKASSPLDIMQHIATLLTTGDADGTPGDGKDMKVNRGVVVTGHASADRIEALVLVTHNVSGYSTGPVLLNPVMVDISDEDAEFALKVVEKWGDEPSFEEYSKNVFAMLNIFRVDKNAPARDFLRYVIRQCYPKMVFRMQLANVVWEEPPMTVIENYFKSDDHLFNPSKPFPWRLRIRKADSFMVDRLKICHPELDARTAIYEVNANNVADWVNKLVVTYDKLTRYLAERTDRGALKPKKALERKFADAALLHMLSLDAVMIRMGFLEHLLSDSRLADQLARKSVTFSDEDEDDQPEEDEDVIDRDAGEVADLLLQRGEDTAHHVVGFYKSVLMT